MIKKALCVKKLDIFKNDLSQDINHVIINNPTSIFNKPVFLLDRAVCEKDENYLQLIPYVTLIDKASKDFFIYQRGKASNETRLSGKCSIGLGGHIEQEPNNDCTLLDVIVDETLKELNEEVGLEINNNLRKAVKEKFTDKNFGVMYYFGDEVGKVHLGLFMFLFVDKNDIGRNEKDIICNGKWLPLKEINRLSHTKEIELEQWSNLVIDFIKANS